jgi:hypothetical protein
VDGGNKDFTLTLHKQHGKRGIVYSSFKQKSSKYRHFRFSTHGEIKGWGQFDAMLFTLWASLSATTQQVGKAGGLQILRCQGFAVGLLRLHPWRLGSKALRLLQR